MPIDNYQKTILDWYEKNDINRHYNVGYLSGYMKDNVSKLDFYWGLYFMALTVCHEDGMADECEKYIYSLRNYPANGIVKFIEAFVLFRGKGDFLHALDIF